MASLKYYATDAAFLLIKLVIDRKNLPNTVTSVFKMFLAYKM